MNKRDFWVSIRRESRAFQDGMDVGCFHLIGILSPFLLGHYASHIPCGPGRAKFSHDLSHLPMILSDQSEVLILQGTSLPCDMTHRHWEREGIYFILGFLGVGIV